MSGHERNPFIAEHFNPVEDKKPNKRWIENTLESMFILLEALFDHIKDTFPEGNSTMEELVQLALHYLTHTSELMTVEKMDLILRLKSKLAGINIQMHFPELQQTHPNWPNFAEVSIWGDDFGLLGPNFSCPVHIRYEQRYGAFEGPDTLACQASMLVLPNKTARLRQARDGGTQSFSTKLVPTHREAALATNVYIPTVGITSALFTQLMYWKDMYHQLKNNS